MLSENIKNQRKAKGLSQEELALRLNVVRQTISKWEQGLSVPDAELLIRLAEELDTTVSQLLDKTVEPAAPTELEAIAAKLEVLNGQFAAQEEHRRKTHRAWFAVLGVLALGFLGAQLLAFCYGTWIMHRMESSTAIIGGSDGPTQIFIASEPSNGLWLILGILLALISAIGLYKTKR